MCVAITAMLARKDRLARVAFDMTASTENQLSVFFTSENGGYLKDSINQRSIDMVCILL